MDKIPSTDREIGDSKLARAALAGDELAFRQLYRRHTPALEPFLARALGAESGEVMTNE